MMTTDRAFALFALFVIWLALVLIGAVIKGDADRRKQSYTGLAMMFAGGVFMMPGLMQWVTALFG